MSALVAFDGQGAWGQTLDCPTRIAAALKTQGIFFGRWPLKALAPQASAEQLQVAYAPQLAALEQRFAIRSVDRVRLAPGQADWAALRQKFIAEHTHADAEIRFFLGGAGLFYIRTADGHLGLLCEAGDWVALPAGLRHFFDAGEEPDFDALRLFTAPDGWVAQPTGAAAAALPLMDDFVARLAEEVGVDVAPSAHCPAS